MSNSTTGLIIVGFGVLTACTAIYIPTEYTDEFFGLATGLSTGGIGIIGTDKDGKD